MENWEPEITHDDEPYWQGQDFANCAHITEIRLPQQNDSSEEESSEESDEESNQESSDGSEYSSDDSSEDYYYEHTRRRRSLTPPRKNRGRRNESDGFCFHVIGIILLAYLTTQYLKYVSSQNDN